MQHLNPALFRSGDPNFMTSLARGIEVLSSFQNSATGLRAPTISKRTGLSRAVVSRCLYTLSELGYVRQADDGYYLEPKILSLSQTYFKANPLLSIAPEYLNRVKEQAGESCSLAVLDGSDVVYIARSAARRVMTVSLGIGSRLPAYCTSLGRVLFAALPPSEQRKAIENSDRVARTKYTITDSEELMKIFESANRQGYAIINEELEIGLRSLATPVRDQNGAVVAAMNIGLQAPLVSEAEMLETMLPVLSDAASELSSRIIL